MKNKFLLFIGGLLLVVFLTFGTYFWYIFFLNASASYGSSTTNDPNRSGDIVMTDDGNNVVDADANNHEGDNLEQVAAYNFKVRNTNLQKGNYTLYIEDVPVNTINDGCTEATLLKRSQLRYQLIMNDEVIKEDKLSNIKDNILDSRSIGGNKTNTYKLRIYIASDTTDWQGKHYHYKVVMNKEK